MKSGSIRVLVADDSMLFATALVDILEQDPELEIVGVASDGRQAVEMTQSLRPQVVTMDVRMPILDGLAAVEGIMTSAPTPILVLTADPRGESGELAFEALARGAVDLMPKPLSFPGPEAQQQALRDRIRLLAGVAVVRHPKRHRIPLRTGSIRAPGRVRVVAIGASTGGPQALAQLLADLPAGFGAGIVVVQHMSPGFLENLTRWLNAITPLDVRVGVPGDVIEPGVVLVTPDEVHAVVDDRGRFQVDRGASIGGHRPSATRLFESVARSCGPSAIGLQLTGMGRDGAEGLLTLRRAGGVTVAQDRESSAIYGMPGAAVELGAACRVLPLRGIGPFLAAHVAERFVGRP